MLNKQYYVQFSPDLIIVNGNVITVDNKFSVAEAVAVKKGRIVAVGNTREIKSLKGKETQIIDLHGLTMLPGIHDAHIHASSFGASRPPFSLDLQNPNVRSIRDIVELVARKVRESKTGEWICGVGWDEGYIRECQENPDRHPTKSDLDSVSPNNPVCLTDFSGHVAWVNSKALEVAGINKETIPPDGSEIVRDPISGELTGLLRELPAIGLVMRAQPLLSREQKKEAILVAIREINSLGITSITEPGLGPGGNELQRGLMGTECISIYNDLLNENMLTVRVNILLLLGEYGGTSYDDIKQGLRYLGIHTGFGNKWLRIAGLKLFADGIPPSGTAWMYRPYFNGKNGSLVLPGKDDSERLHQLENIVLFSHRNGFQLGIHATGDKAIDACVDSFVKALKEEPRDLRHYIIHGDFISESTAKRMAEHNIGVCVQSSLKWMTSDLMEHLLGEDLSDRQWPLRLLISSGVHVSNSSDAPVTYPDWRQGIESAISRKSKASGKISGADQRISRVEAIRTYTIEGAWQNHMEHLTGSIEIGKLADFCVLGENILKTQAERISSIPVIMTIVNGNIVFNRGL